jgi:hypothetical protein
MTASLQRNSYRQFPLHQDDIAAKKKFRRCRCHHPNPPPSPPPYNNSASASVEAVISFYSMTMLPRSSARAVQSVLRKGRRRLLQPQQYHAINAIHQSSNNAVAARAIMPASASVLTSTSTSTTTTGRRCNYYHDNNSYCRSIRDNNNIVSVGVNPVKTNANTARFYSATSVLDQQQQQQQPYFDDDNDDYNYNDNSNDESTVITATSNDQEEPNYSSLGSSSKLNLFTAINSAMRTAMQTDPTAIVFGEDVAFGGVFRCSQNLSEEFGEERVFNTPLSENGIAVRELSVFRRECPWLTRCISIFV